MPALCVGMACSYNYEEGTSLITGYTLNPTNNQLTINGSDLVAPTKVEMGYLDCSNIVASVDQITCDLAGDLPAGSWFPIVTEDMGQVKIDSSVSAIDVDWQITSVTPNININPAGGDNLIIEGTNFPESLDPRYNLSINLDGTTRCVINDITKT